MPSPYRKYATIDKLAEDMIALCEQQEISIKTQFNGVTLLITQDDTVEDVVERYQLHLDVASSDTERTPEEQEKLDELIKKVEEMLK